MELERIEHININVPEPDLDASVAFYRDVLGLTHGERPPFKNAGAWLYLDGSPFIHLSSWTPEAPEGSGAIDHIAFKGREPDEYIKLFEERGIEFDQRRVPDEQLVQLFLRDPSGILIELIFETGSDLTGMAQH